MMKYVIELTKKQIKKLFSESIVDDKMKLSTPMATKLKLEGMIFSSNNRQQGKILTAIKSIGITTPKQLAKVSRAELLATKNVGMMTVDMIKKTLVENGFDTKL